MYKKSLYTFLCRWNSLRAFYLRWRNPSQIEQWQVKYGAALVTHAYANIPAYRAHHEKYGPVSPSIVSLKDWATLPTISKRFFFDYPLDERIDRNRSFPLQWSHTSGTSGQPISILHRNNRDTSRPKSVVFSFLYSRPWVIPQMIFRLRVAVISPQGNSHSISNQHKQHLFIQAKAFRDAPLDCLRKLVAFKADILKSLPSLLMDTATTVSAHDEFQTFHPKYVVSYGDTLTPVMRNYIETSLHCEVFDQYGMRETGVLATECSRHDGMHINAGAILLEIVDETGSPVTNGDEGRIIVTDLFNYNMPIIRYDTGDKGFFFPTACTCGLNTRRLQLFGRTSEQLTLGEQKINLREFDVALKSFMNKILHYQIVKLSSNKIILQIIPGPLYESADREHIRSQIGSVTGDSIHVSVECVTHLERSSGQKSIRIVDKTI